MLLFANLFQQELLTQLGEWVVGYSLVFSRIIAFLHTAPVFSHKSFTSMERIGFGVLLSFIFLNSLEAPTPPAEGYYYPYALLLNITLGLIIGFVANLMFATVVAGGEMMDSSMGFSSGQLFDPSLGSQTTIIGRFMSILSIVVFFAVKGPEMLIQGLYNGLQSFNLYDPNISLDIGRLISLTGDIIEMGFIIVSPIVLTILVNDLVLGLVSRASPQINAFQISFTVKPSIGSIIFILTLPLFFSVLMNFFTDPSRLF